MAGKSPKTAAKSALGKRPSSFSSGFMKNLSTILRWLRYDLSEEINSWTAFDLMTLSSCSRLASRNSESNFRLVRHVNSCLSAITDSNSFVKGVQDEVADDLDLDPDLGSSIFLREFTRVRLEAQYF